MTLTIITPYVAAHAELMARARASVQAQTMLCEFIPVYDEFRQGVAWARNTGVGLAHTELVGFLDADDVLAPDYAEKMVGAWRAGHYTYCDFFFGGRRELRETKDCIRWRYERRHTVTCVMSKEDFMKVGGFDPAYLKAEDVEFWARCHFKGITGIRVPYPLMHYTDDKPVKRFELQNEVGRYLQKIYSQYAGVMTMGCCGDDTPSAPRIIGGKAEGDVLVKVNWKGNKTFHGKASGRDYPYNGNGKLAWIDPRDQQASPDLFPLVEVTPTPVSVPSSILDTLPTDATLIAADNFQIEPVSALPLEEKPKRSRSKKS